MARSFPGTTADYLSVGDVAALDIIGTELTMHAFVRLNSVAADMLLMGKWDQGGNQQQYDLAFATGSGLLSAQLGDGAGAGEFAAGTTVLTTGVWYGVGLRKHGTGAGALQVWVNGREDGEVTSNLSMTNTTASFNIGRLANVALPFNGAIAHVCVWDIGLSNRELSMLALGVNPLNIRPGNLKGYWPLNDYGTSGLAADLSPFKNNGTMNGAVGLTADPINAPFNITYIPAQASPIAPSAPLEVLRPIQVVAYDTDPKLLPSRVYAQQPGAAPPQMLQPTKVVAHDPTQKFTASGRYGPRLIPPPAPPVRGTKVTGYIPTDLPTKDLPTRFYPNSPLGKIEIDAYLLGNPRRFSLLAIATAGSSTPMSAARFTIQEKNRRYSLL